MQLLYIFVFLLLLLNQIQTLPIDHKRNLQTVYSFKKVTESNNKWNLDTEYDVYQTIMDYYENTIDSSISSSSERLLLNLINLPREELNLVLETQMRLIGLNNIPEKELHHIPGIIGKHIHEMNAHIYSLIQPLVLKNWHFIGLSGMIYSKDNDENNAISFMASFNSAMAKSLLNELKMYDIEEKIKQDISFLLPEMRRQSTTSLSSHSSYISHIIQSIRTGVSYFSNMTRPTLSENHTPLEGNFLNQYISNMAIDLLIELHVQFYDFYTQVKADLLPPFHE